MTPIITGADAAASRPRRRLILLGRLKRLTTPTGPPYPQGRLIAPSQPRLSTGRRPAPSIRSFDLKPAPWPSATSVGPPRPQTDLLPRPSFQLAIKRPLLSPVAPVAVPRPFSATKNAGPTGCAVVEPRPWPSSPTRARPGTESPAETTKEGEATTGGLELTPPAFSVTRRSPKLSTAPLIVPDSPTSPLGDGLAMSGKDRDPVIIADLPSIRNLTLGGRLAV